MYLAHFGLQQAPFGITPDTEFVYPSNSHREGLNLLHFALSSGEGFIKVVGEIGTGKTLLCRNLLAELGPNWKAAYLPNPQLEPRAFLREVADEIGAGSGAPEAAHIVKRLNRRLLDLAQTGQRVVLCIDEAQTMPRLTLESLRLLSNLETEKRKLLHIILFGQPELDEMLAAHSSRQIRQRIVFHHQLRGLDVDEVGHYVEQRLRIAGHNGDPLLPRAAVKALHRYSGGTPRLVNILAHKALLTAFGEGRPQVEARHVKIAAEDTEGVAKPARWSFW
ncbi:MAG: AAA family ATPase [Rhodocyclaceae bacterium]|nr:AAA family ATPase [Rhodocyclaceae bacterium]